VRLPAAPAEPGAGEAARALAPTVLAAAVFVVLLIDPLAE